MAVQSAMEAVLFVLVQKHRPDLLQERKWDCPESSSLQAWLELISCDPEAAPDLGLSLESPHVQCVLVLHRGAVERSSSVSYNSLRRGVVAAALNIIRLCFARLAPVMPYVMSLCSVVDELPVAMEKLEAVAKSQLVMLSDTRAEIAGKRAALDAEEEAAHQHFQRCRRRTRSTMGFQTQNCILGQTETTVVMKRAAKSIAPRPLSVVLNKRARECCAGRACTLYNDQGLSCCADCISVRLEYQRHMICFIDDTRPAQRAVKMAGIGNGPVCKVTGRVGEALFRIQTSKLGGFSLEKGQRLQIVYSESRVSFRVDLSFDC